MDRIVFFCENGYMAMMPSTERASYRVFEKKLPPCVHDANKSLMLELEELGRVSIGDGLLMFPNMDKRAKITLELLSNGREKNQEILDEMVLPYLCHRLGMDETDIKKWPSGKRTFAVGQVAFDASVTKSSIEFDNRYMPTKEDVNKVLTKLMDDNIDKSLLSPKKEGIVFIGMNDSPTTSDFGITSQPNIGIKINPHGYSIREEDKLVDIMEKEASGDVISLPVFYAPDGVPTKVLGNGDAAAHYLDMMLDLSGEVVHVKDHDKYADSMVKILFDEGYVETDAGTLQITAGDVQNNIYTYPRYITDRQDHKALIEDFESSASDTDIGQKIAKIRSACGLR